MRKKTKEEFINDARKVHGDKYDYSKVEYVNKRTKVCIICQKHGEFWQTSGNHIQGNGCPKCRNEANGERLRTSLLDFLKKARYAHGDKYNYSKVKYIGTKSKVCIVCPDHGEFWQEAKSHTNGVGCPKCSGKHVPTTKEWITSAREVHKDKYDYSKVKYVNNHTKVCIICPEHGEFWQRPNSHLQGGGCSKCYVEKKRKILSSDTEDFIKKARKVQCYCCSKCANEATDDRCRSSLSDFITKARKVHGDKYNYSKVEYVKSNIKVCIICSEHGEFWQTPTAHLSGQGCPKCCANYVPTTKEWIVSAREVHCDKYDYSKVDYVKSSIKVCIICPEHGEFWQTPNSHLRGCGCPKCGNKANAERKRSYKEEFIKKSRKKHGDKYDYSEVEYVNVNTKVHIICPEHGEFEQLPNSHLQGCGCPKCGIEKMRESISSSKEDFIKKAREVHGNKYDYSKVEYVNNKTKVSIICPEHGEFEQIASYHMCGNGCPKCNLSHLERSVMNYLDEHGITYDYQKRFKWLGRQSLDFYLPDYNVGIECQGKQHFFPVDYFGGDKEFKNTLERDKRKKALCEKHGIKLLYFGNVPNYDTFLGEVVHDDVQYLIDYLEEHKKVDKKEHNSIL
jgi:hypothetical protein